jgi:hypothetical protein
MRNWIYKQQSRNKERKKKWLRRWKRTVIILVGSWRDRRTRS